VLAVNSYVTNSNCSGVGYSARVNTPDVLAWIHGFLPWVRFPCMTDGAANRAAPFLFSFTASLRYFSNSHALAWSMSRNTLTFCMWFTDTFSKNR